MDNFGMQPPTPAKKTLGPPTQLYLPPRDNKKKTLIIVACVCTVVLAFILGGWFHHVHSPAYRLRKGFQHLAREMREMKNPLFEKTGAGAIRQMMAQEGFSANSRLNMTFDTGDYFLGELTFGVDTQCEKDMQRKEMSSATVLSMMNYEFGHVEIYGDNEKFCFSVPELLLENLYIENENVLDQYNHSYWADMFGKESGDDFSIDLFADQWIFADENGVVGAFLTEYAWQLEECRKHMTIEKAGKELYRVKFDPLYFNELVRQVLYDYVDYSVAGREEAMGILSYFDVISNADISFLIEMDNANRIESIRIEEPLTMCQGEMQISGDIYFLGAESSLEKVQGKVEVKRDREEETESVELTWQVLQSLASEDYQMESDIRCSVTKSGEKQNVGVEISLACDGRENSFETEISTRSRLGTAQLTAEGSLSHIKRGESFDLEVDEAVITVDDEEFLLIRGEFGVEPLARRVKQNVKPEKAFFEMSEREWNRWADEVINEFDYLFDGMFC